MSVNLEIEDAKFEADAPPSPKLEEKDTESNIE